MEGYCSSCKIRFEGKRCTNPNCTLHGVAVQMQHAEEQRIDPDTRQALNDHYRDCAEKEAQERRVEQQLLQDAGIMHTTTQAPFPAHVLVVGGCFGFVLTMLLIATWFSFSASTEPTVVHAPSPGFYSPTQGQFRPAPVVPKPTQDCEKARKKFNYSKRMPNYGYYVSLVGCSPEGVKALTLKPGRTIVVHYDRGFVSYGKKDFKLFDIWGSSRDEAGSGFAFPKMRPNALVAVVGKKAVAQFGWRKQQMSAITNRTNKPQDVFLIQNSLVSGGYKLNNMYVKKIVPITLKVVIK